MAVDKSACQAIIQQSGIFVWYADASHISYPMLPRWLSLLTRSEMQRASRPELLDAYGVGVELESTLTNCLSHEC